MAHRRTEKSAPKQLRPNAPRCRKKFLADSDGQAKPHRHSSHCDGLINRQNGQKAFQLNDLLLIPARTINMRTTTISNSSSNQWGRLLARYLLVLLLLGTIAFTPTVHASPKVVVQVSRGTRVAKTLQASVQKTVGTNNASCQEPTECCHHTNSERGRRRIPFTNQYQSTIFQALREPPCDAKCA